MSGKTFVEKIFGSEKGSIVFKKPDIVLTHDNTVSIEKTFKKMGGENIFDPDQLLVVLDHNAPPTNAKLANDYQRIREFIKEQGVKRFYDVGSGICHQIMANHAKPGNDANRRRRCVPPVNVCGANGQRQHSFVTNAGRTPRKSLARRFAVRFGHDGRSAWRI